MVTKQMKIQEVHIDTIKPYWRNPRNNDKAVEAVKKSISEFGYNSPIVVDKENVIIAGHTRYKALRQLGYDDIAVIVLDISKDKAKQYRIADNKTSEKSTWDEDLLMFELREIEEIQDMDLFFRPGELDRYLGSIDTGIGEFEETETVEVAVAQSFIASPMDRSDRDDSAEDERRALEAETARRMEDERRRRDEAERERMRIREAEMEEREAKIREQEAKMKSEFSDRDISRKDDMIKVTCPHCDEVYALSKGDLLRRAERES